MCMKRFIIINMSESKGVNEKILAYSLARVKYIFICVLIIIGVMIVELRFFNLNKNKCEELQFLTPYTPYFHIFIRVPFAC